MKVILLQDVPDVGRKGEVQEVSKGFARNFLLKKNLAKVATAADETQAAERIKKMAAEVEANRKENAVLISRLKDANINITPSKTTSAGKLFGSLSEKDVVAAIVNQFSISIDPKTILLSEPLKKVGSYKARVVLGDASTEITINILNPQK
jgi:large subunit ribosomal protein L9